MTNLDASEHKLLRIYSDRRQQEVLLRVLYDIEQNRGCTVYQLQQIEELE